MNLEFTKGEYDGNRLSLIREIIQRKRPFVIYTFSNQRAYRQMVMDLSRFGELPYIRQSFIANAKSGGYPIVYPSLFVTNYGTQVDLEEFKRLAVGSMKQYGLDSLICLYDGAITSYYRNGEHYSIGTDIVTSLDPKIFESYYFQIESTYYTFN